MEYLINLKIIFLKWETTWLKKEEIMPRKKTVFVANRGRLIAIWVEPQNTIREVIRVAGVKVDLRSHFVLCTDKHGRGETYILDSGLEGGEYIYVLPKPSLLKRGKRAKAMAKNKRKKK